MIIETRVIFLCDLDVTIFYASRTLRRGGGDDKAIKKLRDFWVYFFLGGSEINNWLLNRLKQANFDGRICRKDVVKKMHNAVIFRGAGSPESCALAQQLGICRLICVRSRSRGATNDLL